MSSPRSSGSGAPFKVVLLDMDGTMLNNDHQISSKTKFVLEKLSADGIIIGIATGRSHISVISYMGELNLQQKTVPIVCFNGACALLYDTATKSTSTIFVNPVCEASAREIHSLAIQEDCVLQWYNPHTGEVSVKVRSEEHFELIERYAALTGKKQTQVEDYESFFSTGLMPAKLLILTKQPDYVMEQAVKHCNTSLHMIRGSPDPFFVEFLTPGVHKGSAMEAVLHHFDLDSTAVIAFGDGENDAEMLAAAGRGVAMLNGRPKAKEAANDITQLTNDDDGVALYLEELFGV